MSRARRIALVVGTIVALVTAWEVLTSIVAYTDDAYVRSDLVQVAPQVTGPVIAMHVADNEIVRRGQELFTIDPTPFRLMADQRRAEMGEAVAQIAADAQAIRVAQDGLATAGANAVFARQTQARAAALVATRDVSRQTLDQANDQLRVAEAALHTATAQVDQAQASLAMHQAARARAQAALAYAEWQLAHTHVVAPADGTIVALTLRRGDMARENLPLIGIVDAHAWRVMANYKQFYIRDFRVGGTAWVWLESQPWHLHRAHIQGIAKGISREADTIKLLPYVAPTTDWIRLQRRFPVTIVLDDDTIPLFMGADARTVIFP